MKLALITIIFVVLSSFTPLIAVDSEQHQDDKADFDYVKRVLLKFLATLKRPKRAVKKSRWSKWTGWSPCSATCGKGRSVRWRQCRANCAGLETEMEEVACQLPDCPRKLFGFIKLS